jgi:succinate dehydrogenase / fumarate reductase, iron-sulfur subunit
MISTLTETSPAALASNRKSARAGRSVIFKIRRSEGPNQPQRWESFQVTVDRGANVISCLLQIAANPTTVDGKKSTPVVWDSGCLEEVCGSCTMIINGKVRQSCSCLIDDYAPNEGDMITLEPMTKFPVVRDLAVDRERMFNNLRRLKAWVPIDGTYNLGGGARERPQDQAERYKLSECMTCGCCLEACPQFNVEPDSKKWAESFVGAQAIGQAHLFNKHEIGATLKAERLDTLMGPGGVDECGNAQNCVKVCPKHIPLTEAIAAVGRALTIHSIKSIFSR